MKGKKITFSSIIILALLCLFSSAAGFKEIESDKAKTIDVLINMLKEKEEVIREAAAIALGEIKAEKAAEPLFKALKDKRSRPSRAAKEALIKIASDKVVELLINGINDGDSRVQRVSIDALGEIKSEKAVKPLLSFLSNKKNREFPHYPLATAAVEALGKIYSREE